MCHSAAEISDGCTTLSSKYKAVALGCVWTFVAVLLLVVAASFDEMSYDGLTSAPCARWPSCLDRCAVSDAERSEPDTRGLLNRNALGNAVGVMHLAGLFNFV